MHLHNGQHRFMAEENNILVEVAYALPDEQIIIPLHVKPGTNLTQAIELSGILDRYPDIDLSKNKIGLFGKLTKADTVLEEKDRVEIYRPLIADPKESRRRRAEKKSAS